jgi:hypothetical protein
VKASTAKAISLRITCPPIRSGSTALGCSTRRISRPDCRTSTSVRIILMPPPVDPAAGTRHDSSSIHIGTKIGHCPKSVFEKPQVVASATTLNAA